MICVLWNANHRDKFLTEFSICCKCNSICLRLDMFASQTRIYLISNWRVATIYRVLAKREHIESTNLTYRQSIFINKKGHLTVSFSFCGGERGIRSCFLLNMLNFLFCNGSQKTSVTVLKTTHRVVLLTAFESFYCIPP